MRLRKTLSSAVWLLALTSIATARERVVVTGAALPSVDEIVRRAIASDELRRQRRLTMECDQTIHTERLNEKGEVFKDKTKQIVHHEQASLSYDTDAQLSGAKPDGDTVKAERRAAALNLHVLAPRFTYTLTSETTVNGRACYVIHYVPKPGQPAASREEKVINGLTGDFMVDKANFEMLEGRGTLAAPVHVAMLSEVKKMDFTFHTQRMPNGDAGPGDFSTELVVVAPFYYYHQRQDVRQADWR